MIQGDICYHTFKLPDKRRPVLILTQSGAIQNLTWLTIAPITTTVRNLPTEDWLDESDGLTEICAVSLDNIQTIQKDKLGKVLAHLPDDKNAESF